MLPELLAGVVVTVAGLLLILLGYSGFMKDTSRVAPGTGQYSPKYLPVLIVGVSLLVWYFVFYLF